VFYEKASDVLLVASMNRVKHGRDAIHCGNTHSALGVLHLECHKNNEQETNKCYYQSLVPDGKMAVPPLVQEVISNFFDREYVYFEQKFFSLLYEYRCPVSGCPIERFHTAWSFIDHLDRWHLLSFEEISRAILLLLEHGKFKEPLMERFPPRPFDTWYWKILFPPISTCQGVR